MSGFVRLADRAVLRVAGEGSRKFLQGLCTQDVTLLASQPAAPAAFLSAKGKLLCDTILVARGTDEVLIDCHSAVSKSLLRLLMRHRLREPLNIEDVSSSLALVAMLPDKADTAATPSDFFPDPRFAALGHRAVMEQDAATALCEAGADASVYHQRRVCCGVPEGPADLPVDGILPLHANLDLLNFICFSKGCYVGQELTARTKHRGAVRKRFVTALAGIGKDLDSILNLPRHLPVPAPVPDAPALPALDAGEASRAVAAEKEMGMLHSTAGNIGLCLLKLAGSFNDAESLRESSVVAEGMRLTTAGGSLELSIRPPPYAFSE